MKRNGFNGTRKMKRKQKFITTFLQRLLIAMQVMTSTSTATYRREPSDAKTQKEKERLQMLENVERHNQAIITRRAKSDALKEKVDQRCKKEDNSEEWTQVSKKVNKNKFKRTTLQQITELAEEEQENINPEESQTFKNNAQFFKDNCTFAEGYLSSVNLTNFKEPMTLISFDAESMDVSNYKGGVDSKEDLTRLLKAIDFVAARGTQYIIQYMQDDIFPSDIQQILHTSWKNSRKFQVSPALFLPSNQTLTLKQNISNYEKMISQCDSTSPQTALSRLGIQNGQYQDLKENSKQFRAFLSYRMKCMLHLVFQFNTLENLNYQKIYLNKLFNESFIEKHVNNTEPKLGHYYTAQASNKNISSVTTFQVQNQLLVSTLQKKQQGYFDLDSCDHLIKDLYKSSIGKLPDILMQSREFAQLQKDFFEVQVNILRELLDLQEMIEKFKIEDQGQEYDKRIFLRSELFEILDKVAYSIDYKESTLADLGIANSNKTPDFSLKYTGQGRVKAMIQDSFVCEDMENDLQRKIAKYQDQTLDYQVDRVQFKFRYCNHSFMTNLYNSLLISLLSQYDEAQIIAFQEAVCKINNENNEAITRLGNQGYFQIKSEKISVTIQALKKGKEDFSSAVASLKQIEFFKNQQTMEEFHEIEKAVASNFLFDQTRCRDFTVENCQRSVKVYFEKAEALYKEIKPKNHHFLKSYQQELRVKNFHTLCTNSYVQYILEHLKFDEQTNQCLSSYNHFRFKTKKFVKFPLNMMMRYHFFSEGKNIRSYEYNFSKLSEFIVFKDFSKDYNNYSEMNYNLMEQYFPHFKSKYQGKFDVQLISKMINKVIAITRLNKQNEKDYKFPGTLAELMQHTWQAVDLLEKKNKTQGSSHWDFLNSYYEMDKQSKDSLDTAYMQYLKSNPDLNINTLKVNTKSYLVSYNQINSTDPHFIRSELGQLILEGIPNIKTLESIKKVSQLSPESEKLYQNLIEPSQELKVGAVLLDQKEMGEANLIYLENTAFHQMLQKNALDSLNSDLQRLVKCFQALKTQLKICDLKDVKLEERQNMESLEKEILSHFQGDYIQQTVTSLLDDVNLAGENIIYFYFLLQQTGILSYLFKIQRVCQHLASFKTENEANLTNKQKKSLIQIDFINEDTLIVVDKFQNGFKKQEHSNNFKIVQIIELSKLDNDFVKFLKSYVKKSKNEKAFSESDVIRSYYEQDKKQIYKLYFNITTQLNSVGECEKEQLLTQFEFRQYFEQEGNIQRLRKYLPPVIQNYLIMLKSFQKEDNNLLRINLKTPQSFLINQNHMLIVNQWSNLPVSVVLALQNPQKMFTELYSQFRNSINKGVSQLSSVRYRNIQIGSLDYDIAKTKLNQSQKNQEAKIKKIIGKFDKKSKYQKDSLLQHQHEKDKVRVLNKTVDLGQTSNELDLVVPNLIYNFHILFEIASNQDQSLAAQLKGTKNLAPMSVSLLGDPLGLLQKKFFSDSTFQVLGSINLVSQLQKMIVHNDRLAKSIYCNASILDQHENNYSYDLLDSKRFKTFVFKKCDYNNFNCVLVLTSLYKLVPKFASDKAADSKMAFLSCFQTQLKGMDQFKKFEQKGRALKDCWDDNRFQVCENGQLDREKFLSYIDKPSSVLFRQNTGLAFIIGWLNCHKIDVSRMVRLIHERNFKDDKISSFTPTSVGTYCFAETDDDSIYFGRLRTTNYELYLTLSQEVKGMDKFKVFHYLLEKVKDRKIQTMLVHYKANANYDQRDIDILESFWRTYHAIFSQTQHVINEFFSEEMLCKRGDGVNQTIQKQLNQAKQIIKDMNAKLIDENKNVEGLIKNTLAFISSLNSDSTKFSTAMIQREYKATLVPLYMKLKHIGEFQFMFIKYLFDKHYEMKLSPLEAFIPDLGKQIKRNQSNFDNKIIKKAEFESNLFEFQRVLRFEEEYVMPMSYKYWQQKLSKIKGLPLDENLNKKMSYLSNKFRTNPEMLDFRRYFQNFDFLVNQKGIFYQVPDNQPQGIGGLASSLIQTFRGRTFKKILQDQNLENFRLVGFGDSQDDQYNITVTNINGLINYVDKKFIFNYSVCNNINVVKTYVGMTEFLSRVYSHNYTYFPQTKQFFIDLPVQKDMPTTLDVVNSTVYDMQTNGVEEEMTIMKRSELLLSALQTFRRNKYLRQVSAEIKVSVPRLVCILPKALGGFLTGFHQYNMIKVSQEKIISQLVENDQMLTYNFSMLDPSQKTLVKKLWMNLTALSVKNFQEDQFGSLSFYRSDQTSLIRNDGIMNKTLKTMNLTLQDLFDVKETYPILTQDFNTLSKSKTLSQHAYTLRILDIEKMKFDDVLQNMQYVQKNSSKVHIINPLLPQGEVKKAELSLLNRISQESDDQQDKLTLEIEKQGRDSTKAKGNREVKNEVELRRVKMRMAKKIYGSIQKLMVLEEDYLQSLLVKYKRDLKLIRDMKESSLEFLDVNCAVSSIQYAIAFKRNLLSRDECKALELKIYLTEFEHFMLILNLEEKMSVGTINSQAQVFRSNLSLNEFLLIELQTNWLNTRYQMFLEKTDNPIRTQNLMIKFNSVEILDIKLNNASSVVTACILDKNYFEDNKDLAGLDSDMKVMNDILDVKLIYQNYQQIAKDNEMLSQSDKYRVLRQYISSLRMFIMSQRQTTIFVNTNLRIKNFMTFVQKRQCQSYKEGYKVRNVKMIGVCDAESQTRLPLKMVQQKFITQQLRDLDMISKLITVRQVYINKKLTTTKDLKLIADLKNQLSPLNSLNQDLLLINQKIMDSALLNGNLSQEKREKIILTSNLAIKQGKNELFKFFNNNQVNRAYNISDLFVLITPRWDLSFLNLKKDFRNQFNRWNVQYAIDQIQEYEQDFEFHNTQQNEEDWIDFDNLQINEKYTFRLNKKIQEYKYLCFQVQNNQLQENDKLIKNMGSSYVIFKVSEQMTLFSFYCEQKDQVMVSGWGFTQLQGLEAYRIGTYYFKDQLNDISRLQRDSDLIYESNLQKPTESFICTAVRIERVLCVNQSQLNYSMNWSYNTKMFTGLCIFQIEGSSQVLEQLWALQRISSEKISDRDQTITGEAIVLGKKVIDKTSDKKFGLQQTDIGLFFKQNFQALLNIMSIDEKSVKLEEDLEGKGSQVYQLIQLILGQQCILNKHELMICRSSSEIFRKRSVKVDYDKNNKLKEVLKKYQNDISMKQVIKTVQLIPKNEELMERERIERIYDEIQVRANKFSSIEGFEDLSKMNQFSKLIKNLTKLTLHNQEQQRMAISRMINTPAVKKEEVLLNEFTIILDLMDSAQPKVIQPMVIVNESDDDELEDMLGDFKIEINEGGLGESDDDDDGAVYGDIVNEDFFNSKHKRVVREDKVEVSRKTFSEFDIEQLGKEETFLKNTESMMLTYLTQFLQLKETKSFQDDVDYFGLIEMQEGQFFDFSNIVIAEEEIFELDKFSRIEAAADFSQNQQNEIIVSQIKIDGQGIRINGQEIWGITIID